MRRSGQPARSVQPAGVDQTHEQIPHLGAPLGLIKQGIFTMEDGLFQHLFIQIIVQWGPGNPRALINSEMKIMAL